MPGLVSETETPMTHVAKFVLASAAFGCATWLSFGGSGERGISLSVESAQARVGRPATPASVAGVVRRQTRRGLHRAGVAGAAAVGTAAAIGTAAYNGVGYYGNPYYQNADYVTYGSYEAANCPGWAYYDKASAKYMDNNGDWRPCR